MAGDDRYAQTGAYLKLLLVRPGKVRSTWERFAGTRVADLDYRAVATVLADGAVGERDVAAVRGAMDGTCLSPEIIDRYVQAFDLGYRHADRLRNLWRGSQSVRMISRPAQAPVAAMPAHARHRTVSVHEMHTLGPDGVPAEHQTLQVIESTVDDLDIYPYWFDTDQVAVDVLQGGRVGEPYVVTEGLYGVDILLDEPLARGERASLHYRTVFGYTRPPAPQLRRGVRSTMRDVTLWVQFHPDRLPARVWWARWDRFADARIVEEREIDLEPDGSVQVRYSQEAGEVPPDGFVGFHWSWQ